MKVSDLIAVLSKFDPDLAVTISGVDFVVIHERTGGYDGHVPPKLQRWIEINSPEAIPNEGTNIPNSGTLENMRTKFREPYE